MQSESDLPQFLRVLAFTNAIFHHVALDVRKNSEAVSLNAIKVLYLNDQDETRPSLLGTAYADLVRLFEYTELYRSQIENVYPGESLADIAKSIGQTQLAVQPTPFNQDMINFIDRYCSDSLAEELILTAKVAAWLNRVALR